MAEAHIAGKCSAREAADAVKEHYERKSRRIQDSETKEADLVAARIVELLSERTFSFRPGMLSLIHERLFAGLLPAKHVGRHRDCNIAKREAVLANRSVEYSPWQLVRDNLEYDFAQFDYRSFLPTEEAELARFARFVSNVWETHPFVEGNTRTTAVFCELVFRNKGVDVDNEQFARNSLFFRNALVRASYTSLKDDVGQDLGPLSRFFENLVLGRGHALRDRDLYCERLFALEGLPSPNAAFADRAQRARSAEDELGRKDPSARREDRGRQER